MFPNQRNQQNDTNKTPNMGSMGNMGNMNNIAFYPYHFINQQFPNQIPPNVPPNQVQQRSKKEPRKRANIIQVQSAPLSQPLQNQLYPTPPPPQLQPQSQDSGGNIDYTMKLMSISDDKLDLFCQLFDIPIQHTRQGIISYFMTTTINKLCQSGLNLLNNFFDFLTNPQDLVIQIREPKIPRIFKQAIGIRSRYILLQYYQGSPFEFSHSALLPQNEIICVGQFISDSLNNAPFGSVKMNDKDLMSVNFGEVGQYFLLGPAENLNSVTFQLNSTLIEHYYVWFVIHYLIPNHSFATDFVRDRTATDESDEQNLVRTSVCNDCLPFSLCAAIEETFHTGFIICPNCKQKVKFDQIKVEYKNNVNPIITGFPSNTGMNNFPNMMISPQSGQISRFNSGNSIGMIPLTPPQINTAQQVQIQPQQQQQQQQQKKPRQKKMNQKTAANQQQPPPQLPIQMPIGLNSMAVLNNIHGMGNMMQMKNMNMGGMMGMNVGMRNPVPINSPMNMNKSLLSPPQAQNQATIPIVQPTMNTIQNQMINGMNQQTPQITNSVQIQIGQNISGPASNQQQPSQQQQTQPQQQQKSNKQPKQIRRQKSQGDENDSKILSKQIKQKQTKAKTQSQPPATIDAQAQQNQAQLIHHSSTPQFLDKQNEPLEKVPEEDDETIIVDTPEMKKAKMAMSGFLCMNLRCTKNEINWKQCVYENDSELQINDENFHIEECHDVDDYLDFVDSFK